MAKHRVAKRKFLGILGLALLGSGVACGPGGLSVKVESSGGKAASASGSQLSRGDGAALAALDKRFPALEEGKVFPPLTEAESKDAISALTELRTGFLKFGPAGRVLALSVTARLLHRFAVDPGPRNWPETLSPSADIFAAGLADPDANVQIAALSPIGHLWGFTPGRTPLPAEELALGTWKEGLHPSVVRRLGDAAPKVRAHAVACLGRLPINEAAAPAVASLADPDAEVRQQVLLGFAKRPVLLSEDAILPHLYDAHPALRIVAEQILLTRGLTQEQLGLAKLVFHPEAKMRSSAIPMLLKRTDIDPEVWLLHLSHDADESVRADALAVMLKRRTPDSLGRVAEMALSDPSPAIKKAARQTIPSATASLPALPGSASLNPKAN